MNILATQYTLEYKSLDIYIAGCKGDCGVHCSECHNPETWNFNQGIKYTQEYFEKIKSKITEFDLLINRIMIFGGEPLDQNHDELLQFLMDLKTLDKEVWLFTRYTLDEIPITIKSLCNYIKCGKYMKQLTTNDNVMFGIKLSTSNQKIYKLS